MSEVSFTVRQNVAVVDSIEENVLTFYAVHRDGTISSVFNYTLPEGIDAIGIEAIVKGFKSVIQTSFNGIADSATAIAKANKAIELMSKGIMPSRATNGGSTEPKVFPYLVQAILRLQKVATAEAWYALSKEERAVLATKEVYQLAADIRTVAMSAEAKARIEATEVVA